MPEENPPAASASVSEHLEYSDTTEQQRYLELAGDRYSYENDQARQLVEFTFELTDHLRDITPRVVQKNPQTILVIRHLTRPKISQMRFEKLVGETNIKACEEGRKNPSDEVAQNIVDVLDEHICLDIAPWIAEGVKATTQNIREAQGKVAVKMAQAHTETFYRNHRKDIQEGKIEQALENGGYEHATHVSKITDKDTLSPGEYVPETKVAAAETQKADTIFRQPSGQLGFVEAKVCGIGIDSSKRLKEIIHKADDWRSEFPDADVFAVVAGEIKEDVVEALYRNDIQVVWEHCIDNFGVECAHDTVEYDPIQREDEVIEALPDNFQQRGRKNTELGDFCDTTSETDRSVMTDGGEN